MGFIFTIPSPLKNPFSKRLAIWNLSTVKTSVILKGTAVCNTPTRRVSKCSRHLLRSTVRTTNKIVVGFCIPTHFPLVFSRECVTKEYFRITFNIFSFKLVRNEIGGITMTQLSRWSRWSLQVLFFLPRCTWCGKKH